ncbi:probable WRKY transcription factor 26 [Vicia villosa]|uniref:probable WRKY transcription factor 26 n=1 Tax=Vicia villosa TaxID=3911 RepID=UPI00273CA579|nr:probable WRKY transcription factor 26 [Vicia villosa]
MDNDDYDLFSIFHSCNANTYTSPTTIFETLPPPQTLTTTSIITNNIMSPQNTTPSYFDDFSLTQENRSFNFSPLKPTDFIELDKLKINFNPTTVNPVHTTTIPVTITPTTTILATSATITTTDIPIPTHITTTTITSTINHDFDQNSNFFHFPSLISEQQMQPIDITGPENTIPNINPTTIVPITTINSLTTNIPTPISAAFTYPSLPSNIFTPSVVTTTPSMSTMINTNPSCHGTNNHPKIYNFPKHFEEQHIQQNQNIQPSALKPATCIEITTAHFDLAYNHPSISKQYARECNQLPNLQPQISSEILPNAGPQGESSKNRKRKLDNPKVVEWHMSVEKLGEDPWEWRKYGQKPIKGSRYPRDYYKCSTFKECMAKKHVEKKPNKENIYVVTYIGEHNHPKPNVDCSPHNKTSKKRFGVKKYGSLPKTRNSDSPSTVMPQFDQPECSNAQVHISQSKENHQDPGLIGSHSPTTEKSDHNPI